jgi:hypothetical protein
MQMLDRVGAHTLGAVMNKVRISSGSYSHSYDYYLGGSNSDVAKTHAKEPDVNTSPGLGRRESSV